MGTLGRTAGRLLGVKSPKVPKVKAAPDPTEAPDGVVDEESREALQRQQERRNITATAGRSLMGAGLSPDTQESLQQNVDQTRTGLEARDTRVQGVVDEAEAKAERKAKRQSELAAAAALAAQGRRGTSRKKGGR